MSQSQYELLPPENKDVETWSVKQQLKLGNDKDNSELSFSLGLVWADNSVGKNENQNECSKQMGFHSANPVLLRIGSH